MAISCLATLLVSVLVTVSFYTLYERKVLSLSHIRVGPNIVGWSGVLQPFSDAIKLFSKETPLPSKSNSAGLMLCPLLTVSISLGCWLVLPWGTGSVPFPWILVVILVLTSLNGMLHLGAGWASNSSYALIGSLRSLAQGVSYEVSLAIILLTLLVPLKSVDLSSLLSGVPRILLLSPLGVVWLVSCLAETNRSPFDFAEGESELVSGFNVEYGSVLFALLFISEYTAMIFMSFMSALVLLGGPPPVLIGATLAFMHAFIWVRASYPRTRYDKLMSVCWMGFLPASLAVFVLLMCVT